MLRQAAALEDSGRLEEALRLYTAALEAAPDLEDALHNRGLLLARLGRLGEAEANHRRYVAAHPTSVNAHRLLADVLIALGRYDEALLELDWVLARDPGFIEALVQRGIALACLRRLPEAQADLDQARARSPETVRKLLERVASAGDADVVLSARNIFLARRYRAQGECDWSGWDDYVAEFRKAASADDYPIEPAVSFMAFHVPLSGAERKGVAQRVASWLEAKCPPLPPAQRRTRPVMRLGILSPDFREHLNAYCILPLFELLDRSRFELFAYSLAADDGSGIRGKLMRAAHRFRDIHLLNDEDAARQIRRDDVDVLVDLAGHSSGGRFGITARRPARKQIAYLGFPGSLGSRRIDAAIVDEIVAGNEDEWTEPRLLLPCSYFLYDFRQPPPDLGLSRTEYGLPQDFVYCAFHKAEKITPDAFDLWMRILARVPRAALWLLSLPTAAQERLRRRAADCGVDPGRLVFAPFDARPRYLARQRLGDLMLDAIHHSGMTTACDALNAGLPLLSVRGSAMASRAGESLLRAAGLPELVAPDTKSFVEMAVRLGTDAAALQALKGKLACNRSSAPLFDTAQRVRELESCFGSLTRA